MRPAAVAALLVAAGLLCAGVHRLYTASTFERTMAEVYAAHRDGQYALAVEKADRAAGVALNNWERAAAHEWAGFALVRLGRYNEAALRFTSAINADPTPQRYADRADAYEKAGETERAAADRAKAGG